MTERRTNKALVLLTPSEKRLLIQLSRHTGLSQSDLLRKLFLEAAERHGIQPPSKDDTDAYSAWWDENAPNESYWRDLT